MVTTPRRRKILAHYPFALLAYGMAWGEEEPLRALDALRRGLAIAQESGNRANETYLAMTLAMTMARTEAEPGDPLAALDNITLAIRHYHDAGNTAQIRAALGLLAMFLDRHEYSAAAAIIASFACIAPTAAPMVSEFHTTVAHLREVLGDQTYESLVHKGEAMTMAAVVAYAYDQMDRVRRQLNQPG